MVEGRQLTLDDALQARSRGQRRTMLGADPDYYQTVWSAILRLRDSGAAFSSDDVRALSGDPPEGTSHNLVGALFQLASRNGLIRPCGQHRSARTVGHGNRVLLWRINTHEGGWDNGA